MQTIKQGPKKRKTFFVRLNIYEDDHERIKDLANAEELSIAEYIHRIIEREQPTRRKKKSKTD